MWILAAIVAVALPGLAGISASPSGLAALSEVGTLKLNGRLQMSGAAVTCPPGASSDRRCYRVAGAGLVPGLGRVSESFVVPVDSAGCAPNFRVSGFDARLSVAGKGVIDLTVAGSAECLTTAGVYSLTRRFTVTGGTGAYATATGSGLLRRNLLPTQSGWDTWSGTLVVPGLEFNLTAPTIRGAASKTIRAPTGAKRTRVRYAPIAQDDLDGRVPVSCTPKSGSLFRLGRTKVRCSATDSSGNTRTATFTVRVIRSSP